MSADRHKWAIPKARQNTLKDQILTLGYESGLEPILKPEQYCAYRVEYKSSAGKLIVKQYTNGTLYVEGSDARLLSRIKGLVDGVGTSQQTGKSGKASGASQSSRPAASSSSVVIEPPYIGTDESGKGDYFGPLVVAGVLVTKATESMVMQTGVRDSKTLTDALILRQAQELEQALPPSHFAMVRLMPAQYNTRYAQYKAKGQTLNNMMADLHSELIATLLKQPEEADAVSTVLIDKFCPNDTMNRALAGKGVSRNHVDVHQYPKAEQWLAVAAASVLARAGFVMGMDELSEQVGVSLPKGAGPKVVTTGKTLYSKGGRDLLETVAKLHFKTTDTLFS
jgi:ribonuclease HIII